MSLWRAISQRISIASGEVFNINERGNVAGGCISQATKLSDGKRSFFVKTSPLSYGDMFAAEALALQEMAASNTVKVPRPVCHGDHGGYSYLVLEYLPIHGNIDFIAFAQQLAAMHKVQQAQFGWCRDNTIGSTPQHNHRGNNWVEFWQQQRLGFQLQLAATHGYGGKLQRLGETLMADFPVLFADYRPAASMLHGDLWAGNIAALHNGAPVIYDPAFYYGDREADLAMTYLFGGFSASFYAAYNEAWPLHKGFTVRKIFYNLYHIINHANLFGGDYPHQAVDMMEQILAEIK
jgi:fructosamine-3-kinase